MFLMSGEAQKICSKCKISKPLVEFYTSGKKKSRHSQCKACGLAYSREWYYKNWHRRRAQIAVYTRENSEHLRERGRSYGQALRSAVIEGYGGQCACCGEREFDFLTLDHIHGGGNQHRKKRKSHGIYLDVINANFPPEYRILCFNCNFATRLGRTCPHQLREKISGTVDETNR